MYMSVVSQAASAARSSAAKSSASSFRAIYNNVRLFTLGCLIPNVR